MASEGLHEPIEKLSKKTLDLHRAIVSLMEELEAVDWYQQRADACTDPELKAILEHNRDEEKEHAAMVLEWIRRQDPVLDRYLRQYLFTEGSIVGIEEALDAGEETDAADVRGSGGTGRGLGIGSLRDSVR